MMFRKTLGVLLCLGLMLSAVGCGEEMPREGEESQPNNRPATTAAAVTTTTATTTTTEATTTTTLVTTVATTTTTTVAQTEEDLIVGEWRAQVPFATALPYLADGVDMSEVLVEYVYTFDAEGNVEKNLQVDESSAHTAFANGLDAEIQADMQERGSASVEEYCASWGCESLEEVCDMKETMFLEGLQNRVGQSAATGSYTFNEDKLILCCNRMGEEVTETYGYTITATRLLMNRLDETDEPWSYTFKKIA